MSVTKFIFALIADTSLKIKAPGNVFNPDNVKIF